MLNDIHNIINPMNNPKDNSIDINHILEKMIIHKTNDMDSYMLNHFLFNNSDNIELKDNIITSIKNHYIILMRKQRHILEIGIRKVNWI